MIIRLYNDYHCTECRIIVESLPHTLTPAQHQRVSNILCGNYDCECGVIRGPQEVLVTVGAGTDGGLLIESKGA